MLKTANHMTITSDEKVQSDLSRQEQGVQICPINEIRIGKFQGPIGSAEHNLNDGSKLWTNDQSPNKLPLIET